MRSRVLVALALGLALAGPVQASHFQTYGNYPTEHDDMGSSAEPDFPGVTGVLGVPVGERVLDLDLDGVAEPTSAILTGGKVLAPGCADDTGRLPNGVCGLWNVGLLNGEGTETGYGVPPRTAGNARGPGPGLLGAAPVRFLDHHLQVQVPDNPATLGVFYFEFNKKFQDAGLGPAVGAAGPGAGTPAILLQSAEWAWYGQWADRNGNGVIDHLQASRNVGVSPPQPVENPDNEFRWFGNCYAYDGATREGWHCFNEERQRGYRIQAPGYVFPGNHHAYCGLYPLRSVLDVGPLGTACGFVGGDLPGGLALCYADAATYPATHAVLAEAEGGLITVLTDRCYARSLDEVDPNEADWEGDPLLGVQDSVAPDEFLNDRSGDDYWDTRMWLYGASPLTYYDQSLITSTLVITGMDCQADPGSPRGFLLDTCRFLDVDAYQSWSPVLEGLLGEVKPAGRAQYELMREQGPTPVLNGADGQLSNRRSDLRPVTGPLDDTFLDPGWSREPNDPGDAYPGATRGTCADGEAAHRGWCNAYAGHRGAAALYGDARLIRTLTYDRAVTTAFTSGCLPCQSGPGLVLGPSPEPTPGAFPRPPGDHRRSLGPGGYYGAGSLGHWQDRAQQWTESYLDLDPLSPDLGAFQSHTYLEGPDGWVGNIVNTTGALRYRGYADEACATDNGPGTHPYAQCHPDLDGALQDGQDFGAGDHGEWTGACDEVALGQASFVLRPAGGLWTVPVFVLYRHNTLDLPGSLTSGQLADLTGSNQPIELVADCGTSFWESVHFVYLPLGNLGLEVTTEFTAAAGGEALRDVDVYRAWGA